VSHPRKRSLLTTASLSLAIVGTLSLCSCNNIVTIPDKHNSVIISVKDQKMLVVHNNKPVKTYPVSTSKFGVGDRRGSNYTPLGHLVVARKIGTNAPAGSVFKGRKRTGEILKPNAPGRDPIVSRIIWLSGKERNNRNAFSRFIYIHGTPEERTIGKPRSYGCIRMKSRDVIELHKQLAVGSSVNIIEGPLTSTALGQAYYHIPTAIRRTQLAKKANDSKSTSTASRKPIKTTSSS